MVSVILCPWFKIPNTLFALKLTHAMSKLSDFNRAHHLASELLVLAPPFLSSLE